MATRTNIEWTDMTWNPIPGCSKVSQGCKNCYAERMANRLKAMGSPRYKHGFNLTLHEDLILVPLKWKKPRAIFVNSMSDLFHRDIPFDFISKIFNVMCQASHHRFQALTKRSHRLLQLSPKLPWPQNVWIGFSAEDQSNFDFRIESALKIPTPVLWVSAEPLLGAISMSEYLDSGQIHWVIAGGESGPTARPTWASWVRLLMHQTFRSETPFFFKQWGEWLPASEVAMGVLVSEHAYDRNSETWRVGRKKAGRLLNGKEFHEFPDYVEEYEQRLLETEEADHQTEEFRNRHP